MTTEQSTQDITYETLCNTPHTIRTDNLVFPLDKVYNASTMIIGGIYFSKFLTGITVKFTSSIISVDILDRIFDGCSYCFDNISMPRKLIDGNLFLDNMIYPFYLSKFHNFGLIISSQHNYLLDQFKNDININVTVSHALYSDNDLASFESYKLIEVPWFDSSYLRLSAGLIGCSESIGQSIVRMFNGYKYMIDGKDAFHLVNSNGKIYSEGDALMCMCGYPYKIVSFDSVSEISAKYWMSEGDYNIFTVLIPRFCDTISGIKLVFPDDIISKETVSIMWSDEGNGVSRMCDFSIYDDTIVINEFTREKQYNLVGNDTHNTLFIVKLDSQNDINRIFREGKLHMTKYMYDHMERLELCNKKLNN